MPRRFKLTEKGIRSGRAKRTLVGVGIGQTRPTILVGMTMANARARRNATWTAAEIQQGCPLGSALAPTKDFTQRILVRMVREGYLKEVK